MDTPVIVAVVVAVTGAYAAAIKLFLDHMKEQRAEDRLTWGNHLSQSVKAQQDTAVALQRVADKLENLDDGRK